MTTGTRYTVTVANLTVGWSYSATHGQAPDLTAPVQLVDPLTYSWAFSDAIPGPMDPDRATFNMVATTADTMPNVAIGHLVRVTVRLGTVGAAVIDKVFRVALPTVTLTPKARYAAALSCTLVDLSTDWSGGAPARTIAATARGRWRERLAELAAQAVVSIGAPSWWPVFEGQAPFLKDYTRTGPRYSWPGKTGDILNRLLVSWHPSGVPHTAVTVYAPGGHPTGYGPVGPSSWEGGPAYALADPATATRVELVPATRKVYQATLGQPLTYTRTGTALAVTPRPPNPLELSVAQLAVSASWCEVPATAKRTRDGAFNVIDVTGQAATESTDANGTAIPGAYNYSDSYLFTASNLGDVATRGRSARKIDSESYLAYVYANGTVSYFAAITGPFGPAWSAANTYLSSESALASAWTYDKFSVSLAAIPDTVAPDLAPYLCPRAPGESGGDGRVVRHVTIADLASRIRFGGQPVQGWVTGGTMTVARGDVRWELQTQPGRPEYVNAPPSAITVAELQAVASNVATVGAVSRKGNVTIADLAYVGPA